MCRVSETNSATSTIVNKLLNIVCSKRKRVPMYVPTWQSRPQIQWSFAKGL